MLCCNSTGRKKRNAFSFIFQPRSHHPCGSGRCACVCVFFPCAPTNSACTFTRGIPASDPLGVERGVTPSWWCRIIAPFRHIFPLLFDIFLRKKGGRIFLYHQARSQCCTRTAVFKRWRPKMGITIIYPVESPACVPHQPASTKPAIGRNSRLL